MKSVVFLLALAFLCGAVHSEKSATIPLFVWSGKTLFPMHNEQYLDTLTVQDMEDSLQALLFKTNSQNFIKTTATPDSIVLFVESQLQTEQIAQYGNAYTTSSNGGAFINLKNIIESSPASMVAPYVTAGSQFSLLDSVLSRTVRKLSKGSVLVIRGEGSTLFNSLSRSDNVQTMSVKDVKADTFSNGVPALVIVCLDKAENSDEFYGHDAAVNTINAAVSTSTKGNYIAMYTGNSASSSTVWNYAVQRARSVTDYYTLGATNSTTNNTGGNPRTYLTGPILEAFMVLITLITMLTVGFCNLCKLQVPEQFETPRAQKQIVI